MPGYSRKRGFSAVMGILKCFGETFVITRLLGLILDVHKLFVVRLYVSTYITDERKGTQRERSEIF